MASTAALPPLLTEPPAGLAAWTRHFEGAELPVLRATARGIAELQHDDRTGPRELADVVLGDPLATARLFSRLSARRRETDATTVEGMVMLKGLDRTYALIVEAPTVEAVLAQHPRALVGFLRVAARARRAADFARTIAAWRHDTGVEEIGIAALMHDFADLLLWCLAPTLALGLADLRAQLPTARTRDLQKRLLGISLHDLQITLARQWRLPSLLVTLVDDDYKAIAELIHSDVAFAERVVRAPADGTGRVMPDRSRGPV